MSKNLSIDFNREITLAETCVYHNDFDGVVSRIYGRDDTQNSQRTRNHIVSRILGRFVQSMPQRERKLRQPHRDQYEIIK